VPSASTGPDEQIERTVIARPGGRPIRIQDVAQVHDGYADARYLAR